MKCLHIHAYIYTMISEHPLLFLSVLVICMLSLKWFGPLQVEITTNASWSHKIALQEILLTKKNLILRNYVALHMYVLYICPSYRRTYVCTIHMSFYKSGLYDKFHCTCRREYLQCRLGVSLASFHCVYMRTYSETCHKDHSCRRTTCL